METPKYHEVIRPLVELAQQAGEWVVEKIIPREAVELPEVEDVEAIQS